MAWIKTSAIGAVTLLFYLSKTRTFSVDIEHLQHMAPLSFGPNAICSASGLRSRDTTWSKAGKNGRQPTSADKCLTLEAAAAAGGVLMFQKVQHEFSISVLMPLSPTERSRNYQFFEKRFCADVPCRCYM